MKQNVLKSTGFLCLMIFSLMVPVLRWLIFGGLLIISSIMFVRFWVYRTARRTYKETQFYKLYGIQFSSLLKKEKGYFHYFVYTELLKHYADHAELFNQLSLNNNEEIIDMVLLHKTGIYAIILNPESKPTQTIKQLSEHIGEPIKTVVLEENTFTKYIKTLDQRQTIYTTNRIHELYDFIREHTKEN